MTGRLKALAVLAACCAFVVLVHAQAAYVDDEQITVTNTAIGLTATKIRPAGRPQANYAVCRLELAEIRYRLNGSAATASVGTLLEVGDTLPIRGNDLLANFSAIRTGGTSGQLDCTYYVVSQ